MLPEKEDFYSHLSIKDITNADYLHTGKVRKDFEIKDSGKYNNLSVQSDTFLLTDVFNNQKCVLKDMGLISLIFFCTSISIARSPKRAKVKLDLFTDINVLLMEGNSIRGRICHAIYPYTKANNTHIKNYDKNKKSSYLNAVFGKAMENVRKHRDIKLVTNELRRNYSLSEPKYHT